MSESPIRIGDDDDLSSAAVDLFAPTTPEEVALTEESALDALRAALAAPVEDDPCIVKVLERPGVSVRFHTRMIQEDRKAWQARATKKKRGRDDEVNEMLYSCLILANTCEAVLFKGVEAHDSEGTPLTFAHRQLWEMVGAVNPQEAIRKLFVKDAHVLLASGEVLIASGFDDDVSSEGGDPT